MTQTRRIRVVELGLTIGVFVLLVTTVVAFPMLPTANRSMMLVGSVVALGALGWLRRRDFVRWRLSGSTIALVVALVCVLSGTETWFGNWLAAAGHINEVLFFGLLPLTALLAFVWSAVQFFRFRSLQFAVEIPASLSFVAIFLEVASHL